MSAVWNVPTVEIFDACFSEAHDIFFDVAFVLTAKVQEQRLNLFRCSNLFLIIFGVLIESPPTFRSSVKKQDSGRSETSA